MNKELFENLYKLDVSSKTEKKKNLTYLSWAYAWAEFKKQCPDATYKILKNINGLPYFESDIGFICYTEVTAKALTYEMWLPVMDGANKAMFTESYEYSTNYGNKTVKAATMFDINKTIMRCLVKNLAMFGLGLYIYAGEDLPETTEEKPKNNVNKMTVVKKPIPQDVRISQEVIDDIYATGSRLGLCEEQVDEVVDKKLGKLKVEDLSINEANTILADMNYKLDGIGKTQ
jgi:hypothetical protein